MSDTDTPLDPRSQRRTERALAAEFAFNMGFSYTSVGAILTGLTLFLGASTFQLGLLSSVGGLSFLALMAAPYLVRVAGGRRRPVVVATTWLRLAVRVAMIAIILLQPPGAIWLLIASIGLLAFGHSIYAALMRAWIAGVVPRERIGSFLGYRLAWAMVGAVVAQPIAGAIVDHFGESSRGFSIALGSGLALGAAALWMAARARDPGDPDLGRTSVTKQVGRSLRFRPFRRMFLFQLVSALASGAFGFLLDVFYLRHLGLSYLTINLFGSLSKAAKGVSASSTGWLRRRVRPLTLMKSSGVAQALLPLLLLTARPGLVVAVPVVMILNELLQGVFSVSQSTMQIRWGSRGDQTADFSVLLIAQSGVGAIVPIVVAAILAAGFGFDVQADVIDPVPIFWVIAIATVVRVAAFALLPSRDADTERSASQVA